MNRLAIYTALVCFILGGCTSAPTPQKEAPRAPTPTAQGLTEPTPIFSLQRGALTANVRVLWADRHLAMIITPPGKFTPFYRFVAVAVELKNSGDKPLFLKKNQIFLQKPNNNKLKPQSATQIAANTVNQLVLTGGKPQNQAAAKAELIHLTQALKNNGLLQTPSETIELPAHQTKSGMIYFHLVWEKAGLNMADYGLLLNIDDQETHERARYFLPFANK